jgi:hypothetical protein
MSGVYYSAYCNSLWQFTLQKPSLPLSTNGTLLNLVIAGFKRKDSNVLQG